MRPAATIGIDWAPNSILLTVGVVSMTQLIMHTVANSIRPIKKFLSLVVTLVKIVKMCRILTFKVKSDPNPIYFTLKNII